MSLAAGIKSKTDVILAKAAAMRVHANLEPACLARPLPRVLLRVSKCLFRLAGWVQKLSPVNYAQKWHQQNNAPPNGLGRLLNKPCPPRGLTHGNPSVCVCGARPQCSFPGGNATFLKKFHFLALEGPLELYYSTLYGKALSSPSGDSGPR